MIRHSGVFEVADYESGLYFFKTSAPIPSYSGDGCGKGGEIFLGTCELVSFGSQGFWMSLIVYWVFFLNST